MKKKIIDYRLLITSQDKSATHYQLPTTHQGFTLIEALIGLTLSAVIGTLLVSTLIQNNGLFTSQTANINQGLNINQASSQINELIRTANAIATSNTVGSPQYTSGANTLVLSLPSIDTSGNVISNTYDYAVIAKDATNPLILRQIIFPNTASGSQRAAQNQVLSTTLSAVNFYYYNDTGNVVSPNLATKISYVIYQKQKAGLDTVDSSASGQVHLRNN